MNPSNVPTSMQDLARSLGVSSSDRATSDVLVGLGLIAAGMALGVSLGLLFAPTSGRRLRADLSERIENLRDGSGEDDSDTSTEIAPVEDVATVR